MDSQFDLLADDYARMAVENPVRAHGERHTLLDALGDLRGMNVLDMGCGEGVYTRLLRDRGATGVTGIDTSRGMLDHARRRERQEPRGLRYLHRDAARLTDAADPEIDGAFDVVVSVYMLPYATSRQELTAMCRTARRALRPAGGRFVAVTLNPDVSTTPGWYDPYGFEVMNTVVGTAQARGAPTGTRGSPAADGSPFRARVRVGDGSVMLHAHRWSEIAHERALRAAGFGRVTWVRPSVSAEGRELYGDAYWQNFLACPQIVVVDSLAGPATRAARAAEGPPEDTP